MITFSCLPGSSQRMLPFLQYFNFHGDKAAAAGYVCVHRLPAARRKQKLQKKKREPSTWKYVCHFYYFKIQIGKCGLVGGAQSGFFNKGKLVILRNATTLYNQSWPLFSSAVMALYWDPVPFILIGRFMKNNAMPAHGKDWTQPPVLDLSLYHWSVFGFKSSTRGRLSAFAF